jgi:Putative zinc dependent peptidase (DUF5700)
MTRKIIFYLIAGTVLSLHVFSQNIEVDYSACRLMIGFINKLKKEDDREKLSAELNLILQTKPYTVMFRHYNRSYRPNHLPVDVFRRMIMSLKFADLYKKGENERADAMLEYWRKFYNNTALYEKNLRQIEMGNLNVIIQKGIHHAQNWLPKNMKIPAFYFFIHPNGGSEAFAIDGSQGYDFFQLPRDKNGNLLLEQLAANVSHESHHLGLDIKQPALRSGRDSMAFRFLTLFIAEGTASKFVDNLPGGCIPAIDPKRKSNLSAEGIAIWKEYTVKEKELFNEFVDDFKKMNENRYPMDSLSSRFVYWLSGYKGKAYFIGAELYGAVYFAFGKETAFAAMTNPTRLFHLYNQAVNKRKLNCPSLPAWLVEWFDGMAGE